MRNIVTCSAKYTLFRKQASLRRATGVALLTGVALVLAGCGSSGSGADPSKSSDESKVSLSFGFNSTPDMAYVPILMAINDMKDTYNVGEAITFGSDNLALQALSQNTIQFLPTTLPPSASAMAKLSNLRIIDARANNQWSFVSKSSFSDCTQLDGKRLGLFSIGGAATAYVKSYIQQNCPNIKTNDVIIADSSLRRQALQADQLDATPLQAGDAVTVLLEDPDKFHELANFAETMPDIGRDVILTNEETILKHPELVADFVKAHLQAIRSIYADKSMAVDQTKDLLEEVSASQVPLILDFFVDHKLWCANGGLGDANFEESLKVFAAAEIAPADAPLDTLVDDGPMNTVLASIGKSTASSC